MAKACCYFFCKIRATYDRMSEIHRPTNTDKIRAAALLIAQNQETL